MHVPSSARRDTAMSLKWYKPLLASNSWPPRSRIVPRFYHNTTISNMRHFRPLIRFTLFPEAAVPATSEASGGTAVTLAMRSCVGANSMAATSALLLPRCARIRQTSQPSPYHHVAAANHLRAGIDVAHDDDALSLAQNLPGPNVPLCTK